MTALVVALMALAATPGAAQVGSQAEVDSLRAEVAALRAQMDSLLQMLRDRIPSPEEARADALARLRAAAREAAPADSVSSPEEVQFVGRQRSLQALNPEISLSGDLFANISNEGESADNFIPREFELSIQSSLDPQPRIDLLQRSLALVQSLDPPGIGGRDLKECLLLQLERDRQQYPLEEMIVRDHLDDLGHNRLPKISKALGVNIETLKEAVENIASLNPRPGLLFGGEVPRFIKPDVVVEEVEGKYVVRVESDYLPRLRISAHYQRLYKEGRKNPEIRQYLKKKFDNAEWLIAAIRQRQSTLQKISEEIVDIQSGFLDHGISHLKPLKMVEVAERVGVHVSTISRAISEKYIQTPRGIFPLKYFFTGGATKSDGSTEARGSVIQRIKNLIKAEDKDNPLSDIYIAKRLAEDFNIKISRRTVTKYREAEGIASSRERRVY